MPFAAARFGAARRLPSVRCCFPGTPRFASGDSAGTELEALRQRVRAVLSDPKLTFRQRKHSLAYLAEGLLPYPALGPRAADLLHRRVICDLFEGPAPYRPRYTMPDFARAFRQGSPFLELAPPQDLDEALGLLLVLWQNCPTITGFPVYMGDVDTLLEPFVGGMTETEVARRLKPFWRAADRLFPDGFSHVNIGPQDSKVGRAILALERELRQTAPNLTLRVDPAVTPHSLLVEAVNTCLAVAKPHFVNHPMMVADHGPAYGVSSCYNSLPLGGGSHTLVRLNLFAAADGFRGTVREFLDEALPGYVEATCEVIGARIRFLVEEARFYEHDFMVKEGLLSLDRFTAMFGIFAVAEWVNHAMAAQGKTGVYGMHPEANALAVEVVQRVAQLIQKVPMPYCEGFGGRAILHAQAGIDLDVGLTPGARIPFNAEPGLLDHILAVAPLHRHFSAGISDIFHFDRTVRPEPEAVVAVMRGAFQSGMRDFTFDVKDGEFVRVTGFLIRRTDAEQFPEKGARHHSDVYAVGQMHARGLFNRPARILDTDPFQGLISRILPFSTVDGPGSRMAIFLQECNLNCVHCHNPTTIGHCDGCGVCTEICEHDALRMVDTPANGRAVHWNAEACVQCGQCAEGCRAHADPHAAWRSAGDVLAEVATAAPFLAGVTLTGGEPTLQPDFVAALLSQMKSHPKTRHLTALLDSNGVVPADVWGRLLPYVDGVAISLKAGSEEAYQRITGTRGCVEAVRRSLALLSGRGKLREVRVVLLEGLNDSPAELQAMGRLLREAAPGVPVRAVPFSAHGVRAEFGHLRAPRPERVAQANEMLSAAASA